MGAGLLVLGVAELYWRQVGIEPRIVDSADLWAQQRTGASASEHAVAIVGTSRFQTGVDPRVLVESWPGVTAHQLAIDGSSGLPILRDLAEDPDFRGLVLADANPGFTFAPLHVALSSGHSGEWAAYARHRPAVGSIEHALRTDAQRSFVIVQPRLNLREVLEAWVRTRRLPVAQSHGGIRDDRFRATDYSGRDVAELERGWARTVRLSSRTPSEAQINETIVAIRGWTRAIRSRGGDVVLVRMPSAGAVLETEEEMFPRARTWDRLAAAIPEVSSIHFQDYPELASHQPREGSHLDAAQARSFTRALADVIVMRGVRAGPGHAD